MLGGAAGHPAAVPATRTPSAACSSATCPLDRAARRRHEHAPDEPGLLLGFLSLRRSGADRLVTGAALAVAAIAVVNLMHFSQGWVQFGYRFSNDFAPFALLLVALALEAGRGGAAIGYRPDRRSRSRSTCGG